MFERSHDHDNSSSTNCGRDILSGEYKNQGYRPKYDYTHPSYPLTPSSLVALLTMPPKRSQKQPPPTPAPGTMEDAPASKLPSRTTWKTGEQLEYMQTRWSSFLTHQNKGTLDRFWPSLLDTWAKRWPITDPSPELVKECGSTSAAILTLRSETNKVRLVGSSPCTTNIHPYFLSEDPHLVP